MKKVTKTLALMLVLTLAISTVISGSVLASAENEGQTEQTLRVTYTVETPPYPWEVSGASLITDAMYRTLIMADSTFLNYSPDLAESWDVSDDGLTYTFVLQDGLKWSDGEDLTAEDVKYSIEVNLKTTLNSADLPAAFGKIVGADAWIDGSADGIEGIVPDGNTIRISMTEPCSYFLKSISQFAIIPKHATEDIDPLELYGSEFWTDPVCCGAFKLGEMNLGNYYTLVPNEYYNGNPWKITKIVVNYLELGNVLPAIKAGDIDYWYTNSPEEINEIKQIDFAELYPVDVLFYRYFVCNIKGTDGNENSAMQDVRVREAILHAIDRETLVGSLWPDVSNIINSGIPNSYEEYNGKTYEYDPEKARQLLEEAGYDFDHTFRILYYYNDQTTIDFMDAIAYYLGEVGIKAEPYFSQEPGTDLYQTRNYDIAYKGLSASSITDWFNEYLSTDNNMKAVFGGETIFDEAILGLSRETDPDKYSELLSQLQELEQENLFKLPLYTLGHNIFINADHVRLPEGITFSNPMNRYDLDLENWEIIE